MYLTIGDEHMRQLESLVLRIVQPKGNAVIGKFAKSENLRSRLRREVHRRLAEEEDGFFGDGARSDDLAAPRHAGAKESGGRTPVLAAYPDRPRKLVSVYKRKKYRARVKRNGAIVFDGKTYNSPSQAAVAVTHRPMNGWWFWKYERSPGDWVRLSKLRQR